MASNLVTTIRNLRHRKARRRRQLAVLEGVRLVDEALRSGIPVRGILATAAALDGESGGNIAELAGAAAIDIQSVGADVFAELADTDSPQGVMAVAEIRAAPLENIVADAATPVLVLDGVQDPGNAGTMIRSAHALGSPGVVMLPGTVDLLNPKVLRASMGAIFRFPVAVADHAAFASWCGNADIEVWAGATDGADIGGTIRGGAGLALVVGNEGAGLTEETKTLVSQVVRIPIAEGAESLNVSVAAAILLHEFRRGGSLG